MTTKQNTILVIGISLILLNAIFGGQIQTLWSTVKTAGTPSSEWGGPVAPQIDPGLNNAFGGVPPTPGGKSQKKPIGEE